MSRKLHRRNPNVGKGDYSDPLAIEELRKRQEKHERLTRGKPKQSFSSVLRRRMGKDDAEPEEEEQMEKGAKQPLLGLDPAQDASIANHPEGRNSGMVIVKG